MNDEVKRERGFVKSFNPTRGFGFIESDRKEFFVHFSAIVGEGYKSLKQGQAVEFEPANGKKGLKAVKVVVGE